MEIRFRTSKLKKICNDHTAAQRACGPDSARKLRQRLDDLDAAACLSDFRDLPGDCEELKGDRPGQLSLRLAGGSRLIFTPDHEPRPTRTTGGLDWDKTTAVLIEEIVDYHGKTK